MKPDEHPKTRAAPQPPGSNRVVIYDTTLRDGTQREGISLSCEDKLRIAARLDSFGVHVIEGGWPGSNPKDAELFKLAREQRWERAIIASFASTRRAGITAEEDLQLAALIDAETEICTVFGKSWTLHVEDVLRTSLGENLKMIEESVAFLASKGRRVVFDAEHFFDGYQADPAYALECVAAAVRGGAEVAVLCDTNGGALPWQVEEVVRKVCASLGNHPVGIHAHNDSGCGVANSLAAVRAGARHVQGTLNGYGERCGNANLCEIIPALELKLKLTSVGVDRLPAIYELSRFAAEVANLPTDEHMPYVGRSAFAHKAGVHVSAMRRTATSYQHVEPALVGNASRVVVSELSGRANLQAKAEECGISLAKGLDATVLDAIKQAEARGFSYEAAEASVALLMKRHQPGYRPPFEVHDYQVISGRRRGTTTFAEATVKLVVGDRVLHMVAEGNGPVAALDAALRRALEPVFPEIAHIHLADYKVRILDSSDGTGAVVRVLIDSHHDGHTWSTVGASANIIEASLHALIDGIEYGLAAAANAAASAKSGDQPSLAVSKLAAGGAA